ncbi:T9SS type A sorting domain-containing protein [Halocola ammonii]
MNFKCYFLPLALLIVSGTVNAQTLEWGGRFGGVGEDVIRAMHVDQEGNTYATGYFTDQADFNIGEDTYEIAAVDFYDVFVVKTDPEGNFLWAKGFGSEMFDYGQGITTNAAGDVFITGVYSGETDFDPGLGQEIRNTNGGEDIFVLKLNALGEFAWVQTFGGDMFDESTGIGVDENDNVYVSGFFNGSVDFDPGMGETILTSVGGNDNFILKINPLGGLEWASRYGTEDFDVAIDMHVSSNGNSYITGSYEGTMELDFGGEIVEISTESEFSRGVFMIQLNTDGLLENVISVSGDQNMTGYAVSADDEGNIYLGGEFYGEADFDQGLGETILSSQGFSDAYIAKYNSNAELLWAKSFQSSEAILNYAIDTDNQGNVLTSGYFETATDFDPDPENEFILNESPANATGAFVSILDSEGNFVKALGFGGVNFLDYHGVGADQFGNIYTAGAFENTVDINPDDEIEEELSSAAFRDNYILKFSPVPTGIEEMAETNVSLEVYPNPAADKLYLNSGSFLVDEEYRVYSMQGKLVESGRISGASSSINLNDLESGLYLLKLSNGSTVKFVKE